MYSEPLPAEHRGPHRRFEMSVVVYLIAISVCLNLASAEKWVKSNPQGNFAMGFEEGFINNGNYEIVVPKGSDEVKRDVLIKSGAVRDSVDMVFNSNTMVFSNWEGFFKLGDSVYTDTPGTLYFMRSDEKCHKKIYDNQGGLIRAVSRDIVDASICQALKAKVDRKMNHFLEFPFKFMLPKPDVKLATTKGFPGGEYYSGIVSGNVYVCQHSVEIPSGDTDVNKVVVISAPGVEAKVTMKVNSYTQIFGKWDGTFYIGDKVYTNEPRVLYIDDNRGGCLKKVFSDHGTTITVAYEKILQADECFKVKNKVFNDMQKLIADPKLLADDKSKPPPGPTAPVTVTSTVVFPKQDQSTLSGPQSTHTVTITPGNPGNNAPGNVPGYRVTGPVMSQSNWQGNSAGYNGNYQAQGQQQPLSSASGITSNVHISSVTSEHPDYPSVTATSVTQTQNPPQPTFNNNIQPTVGQPQVVINQGQLGQIAPQGITVIQPSEAPRQQVVLSPAGEVQLVVPAEPSISQNTLILQPDNAQGIILQPSAAPPVDKSNDLNVQSHNVNIQPDGSYKVDSKSVLLQGLPPNTELVTPEGNVIRVSRSVGSPTVQTVALNNGNSLPVVTLTGNSQTASGNVQTVLTVPPNQMSSQVQHTTTVNVPGNVQQGWTNQPAQPGVQSPLAVNSNVVVKAQQQQPPTKLYFLRTQPSSNNGNLQQGQVLNVVQPSPTVLTVQNQNMQTRTGQIQNLNPPQNSQQTHLVLTTAQENNFAMGNNKPVVFTLQNPSGTMASQSPSNVHLNLGGGGNILIKTQNEEQRTGNFGKPSSQKQQNFNGKESSVFNLMKDLNLPSPVNNLIVNIAENTNFQKKKK